MGRFAESLRDSIMVDPRTRGRPSFFGFDVFLTPLLIKIAFILGCVLCLWLGGWVMVETWRGGRIDPAERTLFQDLESLGLNGYLVGVAISVIGIVSVRVYCEFTIVVFKLYEELRRR